MSTQDPLQVGPTSPSPSAPRDHWPSSVFATHGFARFIQVTLAVLLIALLVFALLLSGLIPGLHSTTSGPPSSGFSTEQAAEQVGASFAANVAGGPWSLMAIWGSDYTLGAYLPVTNFATVQCPLMDSSISAITIPGHNGTYSNGVAEAWIIVLEATTGLRANLLLVVQNGVAAELGQTTTNCFNHSTTALPSGTIDSTAAAEDAMAVSNVSNFVSAHLFANATYYLYMAPFGALGTDVPYWDITYTACTGEAFSELDAEVYGTNGTVHFTDLYASTPSQVCGAKVPLGAAFAMGNPTSAICPTGSGTSPAALGGCNPGDQTYTLTVEASTIDFDNFELEVQGAAGGLFSNVGPGAFAITNLSGDVVASYSVDVGHLEMTSTWQALAQGLIPTSPFTSLYTIVVDMGQTSSTTGLGLVLVATGEHGYTGTVMTSLP